MKNIFIKTIKFILQGIYFKITKQKSSNLIGYILLIPPFFGILSFVINIVFISYEKDSTIIFGNYYTDFFWWGSKNRPSQFPLFFGLLAIAGAYLIKNDDIKND